MDGKTRHQRRVLPEIVDADTIADAVHANGDERFERAASLRDAITTIENLRDRRNNIESVSMGDRDAFGVKIGPAGAIVQVFKVRHGRVVDRIAGADSAPVFLAASPQAGIDQRVIDFLRRMRMQGIVQPGTEQQQADADIGRIEQRILRSANST